MHIYCKLPFLVYEIVSCGLSKILDLEKKVSKGELNDEGRQKILKYFHALIAELEYKYGTNSNNFAKIHCEFRRFDALTVANIKKTISTQSISQKEHLESLVLPNLEFNLQIY